MVSMVDVRKVALKSSYLHRHKAKGPKGPKGAKGHSSSRATLCSGPWGTHRRRAGGAGGHSRQPKRRRTLARMQRSGSNRLESGRQAGEWGFCLFGTNHPPYMNTPRSGASGKSEGDAINKHGRLATSKC